VRALVVASRTPAGVEIRDDVADPEPTANQTLVSVKAVSLNRGECVALRREIDGFRPGWDLAGVVVRKAADGSGPPESARVVGWVNGQSWAELAAVRTDHTAQLPESLSFEVASTLPVAGLTAVGTLSIEGSLLGRRVAITGAAGGVGRFAIQLARMAGAHVTAIVGRREREAGLVELGAHEVHVGFDDEGEPFDLILESAGGRSLATAVGRVSSEGVIVCFGNSSGEPTTFDPRTFYRKGAATMRGYFVTHELLRGHTGRSQLSALAALVADGRLESKIGLAVPWTEAARAIDVLLQRTVSGKAVLTIEP
jgi:NADPH:quinone reductase